MISVRPEFAAALDRGGIEAVSAALQAAIELEHSTIPPYLYALYSLAPGTNDEVAGILRSVVREEMLHMALVCNVVNAIGGAPVLDSPGFLPTYPGSLPGSVESGLIVGLGPFSIDLVRTFMTIEEPEELLNYEVGLLATQGPLTIGSFYHHIRAQLIALGDGAFSFSPRNQIGPDQLDDSVVVTDVESATRAIDTIIDQGEGTATEPLEVVGRGFAHYYRFAEIFNGAHLKPNPDADATTPPDQRYVYDKQAPVRFDPAGVFPAPINPKAGAYPAGGAAARSNNTFNYTYTSLLKVLHETVNGAPALFDKAMGLMASLEQLAKDMMSQTAPGGTSAGPSFEYQPVNP